VLKPRQVGFSTLCLLELIFFASCIENARIGIISYKEDEAVNKLRKVRNIISWLPEEMGISISPQRDNANELIILPTNASVSIESGAQKNTFRGDTYHFVLATEFSHWKFVGEAFSSFESSVPKGGIIIKESTACGKDNQFYLDYTAWKPLKDLTLSPIQYKTSFYPWFMHEEYKENPPKNMVLTDEEKDLQKLYNLTPGQLYWRRLKLGYPNITNRARNNFAVNYPSDDKNCWGETADSPFNVEKLNLIATEKCLSRNPEGVNFYETYSPNKRYFMGVDTAKGGGDCNAMVMIDNEANIIATFNQDIRYSKVAGIVADVAKEYNAIVQVETNQGYGIMVCDRLRQIYDGDKVFEFVTRQETKFGLFSAIDEWITFHNNIRDEELKEELINYDRTKTNNKDDLIMAFGFALDALQYDTSAQRSFLITTSGGSITY